MSDLSNAPIILLTRPTAQSSRFAAALKLRLGHTVRIVTSPLTEPAFLSQQPDLSGVKGLIFTSETGVAAFARQSARRDLPAWTVGPRTTQAAAGQGFAVHEGPGDAEGLVAAIIGVAASPKLLHVRGAETAFPVADTLNAAGIDTLSWIAYQQVPALPSTAALRVMSGSRPVILPLFSANGARRVCDSFTAVLAPLYLACISGAVADAATALPHVRSVTAARPDEDGMLVATGILADASQRS